MAVLLLIVGLLIVVATVYVAMGHGGELSVERADYAPLDLGPVSATDVALLRPPSNGWGYNKEATDEALDRIAESVRERDVRIVALEQLVTDLSRDPEPVALGEPLPGARHRRAVEAPEPDALEWEAPAEAAADTPEPEATRAEATGVESTAAEHARAEDAQPDATRAESAGAETTQTGSAESAQPEATWAESAGSAESAANPEGDALELGKPEETTLPQPAIQEPVARSRVWPTTPGLPPVTWPKAPALSDESATETTAPQPAIREPEQNPGQPEQQPGRQSEQQPRQLPEQWQKQQSERWQERAEPEGQPEQQEPEHQYPRQVRERGGQRERHPERQSDRQQQDPPPERSHG